MFIYKIFVFAGHSLLLYVDFTFDLLDIIICSNSDKIANLLHSRQRAASDFDFPMDLDVLV